MLALLAALLLAHTPPAAPDPAQAALIVEARDLVERHDDAVWPEFSDAPDTLILIDGEIEFLLCHEGEGAGFEPLGVEPVTGCDLRRRPRQFPPTFLASFPAVDGTPSIVVGTPEATGRAPANWMRTLIHERVHQFQDGRPDMYARTLALGLDGGDQTGMWQLNYAFPYKDEGAAEAARAFAEAGLEALAARDGADFRSRALAYQAARSAFLASVSEADARYYEFQAWKEGVARWTELAMMREAAAQDEAYAGQRNAQEERLSDSLEAVDLARQGRIAFYALGTVDAEILDRLDPAWRRSYADGPLALGPHFEAAPGE
jgi:hypothetical protein